MSEWLPIASAPKDGTEVLLTDQTVRVVGKWTKSSWHPDGGWWEDYIALDGWAHKGDFSHWQPLPPPPNNQQ